jgi:indolepyruvate ferredoxin oxidoreductase beta subunit
MDNYNILIVGVGGQGTLLASRILGALAELLGKDCKLSEIHGMSQRGGSVVTNVKIADKVLSPIIGFKDADIILAFEKLEALRYINYLKDGGAVVVNTQEILPMPVITGARKYPDDILQQLETAAGKVQAFDALKMAEELGNVKTVNVIMLGALARNLGIGLEVMKEAVKKAVKPQHIKINIEAIIQGYELQ